MKNYESIEIEIVELSNTEIITDSTLNNAGGGETGGSSEEGFDI